MAKPAHLAKHHTVEMAWWLADPAIQFRVTGQAYVIPSDESASDYQSQLDEVLKGLRAKGDETDKSYWEKERKRLWKEAMSGHLRASFGRPPPGTPLSEVADPKTWPETLPAESVSLIRSQLVESG
jgi:pyridoxamine 5'-phosphate oxidase